MSCGFALFDKVAVLCTKGKNITVLLELSAVLWYNDANNLIRCGGFGGYDVACHGESV